ncbi:SH3 domain-containing protein [Streptococcus sp. zg-JUN1979]|uniref:SH3 domain-containing protein n=1 Tax=Streptococcus sp. zg-JUN1979 TaxID=3391450 RepID=UPI0039A62F57
MKKTYKKKLTSLIALSLMGISSLGSIAPAQAAVLGDNYPAHWKSGYGADSWGMYLRQCTSFVAFRLSSANGFTLPRGYGNAITWGSVARANGYRVDMNPAVGSVAWFSSGVNGAGGYGHVGWVAEVNGDTVTIEEYNFNAGQGPEKYWRRSFHKSQVSGYIHFKDLSQSAVQTTQPSTPAPHQSSSQQTSSLASSGTYRFTGRMGIKSEARYASGDLAYYDAGMSVNYDKTLVADGYEWISYISYGGSRRYIAIKAVTNPSPTPVATPAPKPTSIPSSGRYTFQKRSDIKGSPSMNAAAIAYYDAGNSVNYDSVITSEGHQWISYISYSGARRYIAID